MQSHGYEGTPIPPGRQRAFPEGKARGEAVADGSSAQGDLQAAGQAAGPPPQAPEDDQSLRLRGTREGLAEPDRHDLAGTIQIMVTLRFPDGLPLQGEALGSMRDVLSSLGLGTMSVEAVAHQAAVTP